MFRIVEVVERGEIVAFAITVAVFEGPLALVRKR